MVDHRLLPLILLLNEYPPLVVLHSIMNSIMIGALRNFGNSRNLDSFARNLSESAFNFWLGEFSISLNIKAQPPQMMGYIHNASDYIQCSNRAPCNIVIPPS